MVLSAKLLKREIKTTPKDCLIIVDMQNDFMPGGALAVKGGDEIIEGCNQIATKFHEKKLPVIFTQDWHPVSHQSFASQHPGKKPGDELEQSSDKIGPILWPDHCVQGSRGARFHPELKSEPAIAIIRKGYHEDIDSYSAFLEKDKKTTTGLDGFLNKLGVQRIFVCGLAMDYCVYYTLLDGNMLGFKGVFILNLTRPVGDPEGRVKKIMKTFSEKKIALTNYETIIT